MFRHLDILVLLMFCHRNIKAKRRFSMGIFWFLLSFCHRNITALGCLGSGIFWDHVPAAIFQGRFGPCAETSQCHNVSMSERPGWQDIHAVQRPQRWNVHVPEHPWEQKVHMPKCLWYQNISAEMSLSEMPFSEISSSLPRIPLSRSPFGWWWPLA